MTRSILHASHAALLQEFARQRVLVAFDFDGTLAPIVPRPADASLRPSTVQWLRRLVRRYPTAIISGRALNDLASRVASVSGLTLVGNHGHERDGQRLNGHGVIDRWFLCLSFDLGGVAGVYLEHKGASLSVHWRQARHHREARRRVEEAVAALVPRPRVLGGKAVTNVVPDDGIDKGSVLRSLMRERRAVAALFVGDDETDEDAFALAATEHVIAVRVGRASHSVAEYRLDNQAHVDELMRRLVTLRPASGESEEPERPVRPPRLARALRR